MKRHKITNDDLKGYVLDICSQIYNSNWRPDYVVGISRGGLVPAIMISHYLNIPMKSLQVSLRDGGECVSDLGMAEDAFGIVPEEQREVIKSRWDPSFKKNILLVDDINDSGATFNWIMQDWPSGCFPDNDCWKTVWNKNVRFAVLVDNLASQCKVKMDFSALEINKAEDNQWIVFPYEEWWK